MIGLRHETLARTAGMAIMLAAMLLLLAPEAFAQVSPFGAPGAARPPVEAGGIGGWLLARQAEFHRALTLGMRAVATDTSALVSLMGLAFSYGVIHAVGPGHGKAVIASYLVANEHAMKRGVALAFAAAAVQALVALLLVIVVAMLMGGGARQIENTAMIVEKAGFAIILGMGLAILWRKARMFMLPSDAACAPDCGHDHGMEPAQLVSASRRDLVLTAIGAGIRPCAGAIILLVFALTQKLFWAGALAVAAMAFGTAIGTSLFAALAVKAKALALRLASGRSGTLSRAVLVLELLAGLALALLGLMLLMGTTTSGA